MNVSKMNVVLGLAVALTCGTGAGQQTSVSSNVSGDEGITAVWGTVKPVHSAAVGAEGGRTFDLFLDSAEDILVIDATLSGCLGSVFNDTDPSHAANDHNPPLEALKTLPGFENLNADLWITTPSPSTRPANTSSLTAGDTVIHFDGVNDGPQTGFHWASITVLADPFGEMPPVTLEATIQTANSPTPKFDEVTVNISGWGQCVSVPEPNAFGLMVSALLGGLAFLRRKRTSANMQFESCKKQ